MRALSISSADAFILVYDITDASTFEEARQIRDQIHETKGTSAVPIVVVGNKLDMVEEDETLRQVCHIIIMNEIRKMRPIFTCANILLCVGIQHLAGSFHAIY